MGGPPPPPPPTVDPSPAPSRRDSAQQKPAFSAPLDLLSEIRNGKSLKSVQHPSESSNVSKDTGDSLADALRDALQKRITAVAGSGSFILM
jgi:hypothetical protein